MCLIGGIMSVVLDLPTSVCIWVSAVVIIIYTLLGGLYSVAYTDVIQLILIFVSLVSTVSICFISQNPILRRIFIYEYKLNLYNVKNSIFVCSRSVFPSL